MSWKALVGGLVVVICLGLFVQLGFIMLSVGYVAVSRELPVLSQYKDLFFQCAVFVSFIFTMLVGGYLTALIAERKHVSHAAIVGSFACFISLGFSSQITELTLFGLMFIVVGTICAAVGGFWKAAH